MKNIKKILILLLALTATAFAQQQGDYSKDPGYYDFGNIISLKSGDTVTEVYLEEPLLKMVAQMGDAQEEGLGKMLDGLKLVKVNEFMVDEKNIDKLNDVLDSVDKDLQSKKWNRIIKTKHNESLANVYVKSAGNNGFDGLFITAVDKKGKVTLVNIVGKIDMDALGRLGEKFDIPSLEKVHK